MDNNIHTNKNGSILSSILEKKDLICSRINTSIELLAAKEKKISVIEKALIEGENSPMIDNFDAKKHLENLHRKYL